MSELKSMSCDCGFMVKSHDEKEVVDMGKTHVKKVHKMKVTDKEIKKMIKSE